MFFLTLAGYECTAGSIRISGSEGLVCDTLAFTHLVNPETGEEMSFEYTDVGITGPPAILFEPVRTPQAGEFSYVSSIIIEDIATNGWIFNGITETGLFDVSWLLHAGNIDLSGTVGYTLENEERDYNIGITDTQITPGREVKEGIITEDFFLETGGNLFEVKQALVRGNKIIILKAFLRFIDGFTVDDVIVENFSIDKQGNLEKEPGFTVSEFGFYWNGFYITVTDLDFTGNTLVISQGTITIGDMVLSISGGQLVYEGLTEDLDISLGEFTILLHGFRVESLNALLTPEGILLPSALISLPELFGGGTRELSGLTLGLEGLSGTGGTIVVPGTGDESFTITGTGYGNDVVIDGLLLNQDGLFAPEISTTLPACAGGGEIRLTMLPLLHDPAFGVSQPAEAGVPFTLAGFAVTGQSATFNGEYILFPIVDVELGPGCIPETAGFENLKLDGNGIIDPAVSPGYIGFEKDGWYFDLEAMAIDAIECKGTANLVLPDAFGSRTIVFPQFVLFPDGTYLTGPADGDHYFRLHGWKVRGSGIHLDGSTIQCDEGTVRLYSIMGYETLVIPDIVIDASGNLVSSGNGTQNTGFLSTNAFRVSAAKYKFTPGGLSLCGQVFFPLPLGRTLLPGSATMK